MDRPRVLFRDFFKYIFKYVFVLCFLTNERISPSSGYGTQENGLQFVLYIDGKRLGNNADLVKIVVGI